MPDGPTISNSSCLIALDAVGSLFILERRYGAIEVPEAVARECIITLPKWVRVSRVMNQPLVRSLALELGPGETEAIALALERSAARVVLDDRKARRIARQLHAPVTGTLAVVLRAKRDGVIPSVRAITDALLAGGFRLSHELIQEVLRQAGE